jgi:protocatechuate 4,5-dioxygenase beta chain
MAQIIGGLATSHVPIIGRTMAANKQSEVAFKPFFDAFAPVHAWIDAARPDAVILLYNDHGLNFFLDNMPTFAVGAANAYRNADEGWGEPASRSFAGDAALSWHLVNALIADEFDISTCQEMVLDHAGITALDLAWDRESDIPPIVPIVINAVRPPFPTPMRCWRFGQALGRAIKSFAPARKVLVIASGGLSHELGQFGKINESFDRLCMDKIVTDPEALAAYSNDRIVDLAGAQGLELVNWIVMRGALAGAVGTIASIYHAPISHTGGAMMLLAPAGERQA